MFQGDVGPFKPGLPLEVPLWMATHLRQRQKCRILQVRKSGFFITSADEKIETQGEN